MRRVAIGFVAVLAACAGGRARQSRVPAPAAPPIPCTTCETIPMDSAVAKALEIRLTDLKARGGDCGYYGAMLDTLYRDKRITIKPYMWRVGTHLAAGEAKPSGEMAVAREIDSLNVGVRSIDEITWGMEHEAVHIAFDIRSSERNEVRVNDYVRACRQ